MSVSHDEIDALAIKVEQEIQRVEDKLEALPDFTYGQRLRNTRDVQDIIHGS